MNSYYDQYYVKQAGSGLADIGGFYRSPVFLQRGRGIGNFFSGVYKYIAPFLTPGLHALKEQAIKSTSAALSDIGKKPLKRILSEQGKIALNDLTERGYNKFKRMQKGGRRIKRRKVSKKSHSIVKRKRKRTRKTARKTGKKIHRKTKKRRGVKRGRFVDIFSNNI